MFSRRTSHDPTPNAVSVAVATRRRRGGAILDLTVSNPTIADVDYDHGAILAAWAHRDALVHVPSPFGMACAREAISRFHRDDGIDLDPARIVCTASSSEAYSFLLATLCDPHDDVLVPEPGYPLLASLAQLAGVHLVPYRLGFDGERFVVDAAAIYDAITARTRAVVLCSPTHPTGTYLTVEAGEALEAIGLPLISDEVFARYPLEPPQDRLSTALLLRDTLVFAVSGLSKATALPQMKLSWIAAGGPDHLVEGALERLEWLGDAFLSVSTPVQLAASSLLGLTRSRECIRARCRNNLDALRARIVDTPISVPRIGGGWYASLRLPAIESDEAWSIGLIEDGDVGVLTHPGFFFDFPGDEAWLVVSLLTPPTCFEAGITRIVDYVARRAK